ncbi:DUF4330 domain-containing protein [Leptothoe kymatousa]|uniref:DUF4330 domain-containing protein n=1 Tax=Leptothoe kymatousa TAU-MAC 1615 TaxID=2364775 RepID=A0ABS5Y662_9CYAN|nr:DUF4330 domain-containing protein [Leptothoe kymatousa]MBT9313313.1 DUF4330 domain-containing protein [Leptothoe kymatousa TAU-MAC 1615]
MAILDSKGRLFGKISLLDIGAGLIILMVAVAIFFYPGTSGSVAQVGAINKDIEVDVMVRGLTVLNPEEFLDNMREEGKTNIIIRNQPYGQVGIKTIQPLPRSTAVPQPDGSVKAFPDPRPELEFTTDMLITLTGNAQITDDGAVFGNSKIKIGTPIELEGQLYTFRASTVAVRIPE